MFELDLQLDQTGFELQLDLRTDARRIGLTGPSGAGKTTLLRIVAGLEQRATGRVAIDGEAWQTTDGRFVDPWERGVGWLPQDSLVFPHLNARQNLRYAEPPDELFGEVVDALELGDRLEAKPRTLSGGERQRVALGRALLSEPRLLLLDEPFSALDRRLTGRIIDFLADWCATHDCALLIAAHAAETVDALVDETFRLTDGRLETAPASP